MRMYKLVRLELRTKELKNSYMLREFMLYGEA